jgi:hypothetical protein
VPLLLDLPGLALVLATLVLGAGLASGGPPWLTAAERIVVGLVISVVLLTIVGYLLALALGLGIAVILILTPAGLAAGGAILYRHRLRLREDFQPTSSLALVATIAVLGLILGYLFTRALHVTPDGWLAQYNNTWSDWSFHSSYATAFAYGHNLPPQNPIYAGTPFRYPFAPDFATALLLAAGWSIPAALIWPSWAMTLLALSGLILWARRLTGSIAVGAIAVTLTLLGGGLGFWFFFGDAAHLGLVNALTHIPRTYDRFDPPVNIQWYNPILSYYLPQRSFVFGAAIFLTVLILITPAALATPMFAWRETITEVRRSWRHWSLKSTPVAFVVAGALAGLLPLFHVHSLVALGLVTLGWAILFPRPAWIGFFVAMFVLAVPRLLMAVPGDPGAPPEHQYPRLLAGWLSGTDFPAWFWIKNIGLFWPLLLTALLSPLALRGRARLLLASFVLVFLAGNLIKFQPWEWDNTKVLVFWYLGSAVAVGAVLVRLWKAGIAGALGAAVIWLTLVASGVLSMLQYLPPQGPSYLWFSTEEVRLAESIRAQTAPRAVFVTGERPNNPIADLAGRPVVMSYPGWLWSYGINYTQREADIASIYQGGPNTLDLLRRYHAQYVVIGPDEIANQHANSDYFNARFQVLLRTQNYTIYRVPAT